MTTHAMHDSLALLFAELIDGPPSGAAYMLNGGDPGLLRSLDRISAAAASTEVGSLAPQPAVATTTLTPSARAVVRPQMCTPCRAMGRVCHGRRPGPGPRR